MRKIAPFLIMLLLLSVSTDVTAKTKGPRAPRDADGFFKPTTIETPNMLTCVHKYNNLFLAISNWGFFGSEDGRQTDCETGAPAPSGRFPGTSNIEYLFQGALWIGAVVGDDTLVSVGADGWQWANDMYPCADESDPRCGIERRSFRQADPYYHEDAKSDLEYISIYTDTLNHPTWTPPDWDGSPYIPIGLEITQHSYSWSVDYAGDFILLDFKIKNITHLTPGGSKTIEDLFLGIYSDGDVGLKGDSEKHTDDICGFLEHATAHPCTFCDIEDINFCDPIDLTYICDNDGDPVDGAFDYEKSATGVLGTRVMRAAGQDVKKVSFNWWTSQGSANLDWGPMKEATWRNFGTGGFGTPEGNKNKYYMLSNGEHDYDQIESTEEHEGWLRPNPEVAADLADGGDTRFLLSFGPFNLPTDPDTFLQITIAYVAAEGLHRDPANGTWLEAGDYESFYGGLKFDNLSYNAVWAAWVYDNPVPWVQEDIDPPDCGYCTDPSELDTCFYAGDGIPDFQAAVPPPSPPLRYKTKFGEVYLRWNGYESESFIDPFTFVADFEGYRVYWGRLDKIDKMSRLESRDRVDYKRYTWNADLVPPVWRANEPPLTLDSLNKLYGSEGNDFVPEDWACQLGLEPGDGFHDSEGNIYCFEPTDYNQSIDGWMDGAKDVPIETGIRKVFATEIREGIVKPIRDTFDFEADTLMHDNLDTLWMWDINPRTGDSTRYHKFWEYEYEIGNLLASVPHYFSVTAFDFGEFANKDFGKEGKVGALEGSPLDEVVELWATNDAATVVANYPDGNGVAGTGDEEFEVKVYPNPYLGDGRYLDVNFEQITEGQSARHARELHFVNLPPECTIRIFTLDGDMVKEIKHPGRDSDWDSKIHWNMRTRNNELVSSGIYLYSVESPYGNQVGKFVIVF